MFCKLFKNFFYQESGFLPFSQKNLSFFGKIWYQKWILWLISIPKMYTYIIHYNYTLKVMALSYFSKFLGWHQPQFKPHTVLLPIHTLRVHYAHAAANLNSGYSKYAKVARVHLHSEHLAQCWRERERRVGLIYGSAGLIYFLNGQLHFVGNI